jgi:protein SCO1
MPSAAAPRAAAVRAPAPALLAVGAVLVAAGLATAVVGARRLGRPPEPPRLGVVPDFRLVEHSGRSLSAADLRGRPWVADFIFTQCGGACPAMTARMARLQRELPPAVALVSFTVDPGHDTPEVLARYAETFHAGPGWRFVTGPQSALYDLSVGGFKLEAMEVPAAERAAGGDGPFLHSSKFVLVDGAATIRGYYDSTDEASLRALVRDAGALPGSR